MSRGAAVVRYGEAFQCLRLAVAFGTAPGAPVASWAAALPNQFSTPSVNAAASDLATAGDGTSFALQTSTATEIRTSGLSLSATPASAELAQIPGRVVVPGFALHPSAGFNRGQWLNWLERQSALFSWTPTPSLSRLPLCLREHSA